MEGRKIRFFLDALLSLVLLIGLFLALTSRGYTETARFRRAERASLVGPAEIIDRFDLPEHWPRVNYDRILLADDGEEILFYLAYDNGRGTLYRREKTDGLLLATLPTWGALTERKGDMAVPLFLFVDDPRAVKAEVTLRLSENETIELRQGRGSRATPLEDRDGYARERFFLFNIPVTGDRPSRRRLLLWDLAESNSYTWTVETRFPADIRLYDASGALLETREYVIQSPGTDKNPPE